MSNSGYQVYLSQAQTLNQIVTLLQTKLSQTKVTQRDATVTVAFGKWKVRVVDFQEAWVDIEAKELAQRCKDKAKKMLLLSSRRRLEIYPGEDPSDTHYNHGLSVFEYLSALPGAVGFDPVIGEFYGGT